APPLEPPLQVLLGAHAALVHEGQNGLAPPVAVSCWIYIHIYEYSYSRNRTLSSTFVGRFRGAGKFASPAAGGVAWPGDGAARVGLDGSGGPARAGGAGRLLRDHHAPLRPLPAE